MTVTIVKPILISGAGISSLLLAQSLRHAKIPFLIFERDASFSFRAQGYRLRLSTEGLDAIESVLNAESWARFWDSCGKTANSGAVVYYDALTASGSDNGIPENLTSRGGKIVGVARGVMRQSFAEGCEEHIRWSHHVIGYELTPDGVRAIFADGSRSVEGSMLVAGDGIYSKVAKQVSGGKLKVFDTGARGIHGEAPTTAFKGLGEGVFRIRDDSRPSGAIFVMTNVRPNDMNNPEVKFGWTMGGQPGAVKAPNDDYSIVGPQAAQIAKSLTANWHPRFKPLVDEMVETEAAFWKITCSSPSGVPEWPNEPRVTVIGDAVHSMTPAGGIGANTAVRDSALLGRLLREAGGYAVGVTAAYEKEMRVYGSEAVNQSYTMAASGFGINIDEETTPTV